jgi:hypothetical protein
MTVVALLSGSLIALELCWTRIFSAEFFYTFAFLILSLAVLGLGLGALALRLVPALGRGSRLGLYLTICGLVIVVGPILVFRIGLDFSTLLSGPGILRFLAATVILSSSYFLGGLALAIVFKRGVQQMPRLYMADLGGAGVGVAVVILLMNSVGTPSATVLCALPMLAAAVVAGSRAVRAVSAVLAVAVITLVPHADRLFEAPRDERAPVIYTHWDAMAKVKLYAFGPEYRGINIDNVANSPVYGFDGDFNNRELEEVRWGIDVSYLIGLFDHCTFLSLGAGGGSDVLQALVEGAREVHAVEVNPHINRMMIEGDSAGYRDPTEPKSGSAVDGEAPEPTTVPSFRAEDGHVVTLAEFSGGIYRDPRVRVVSEDARSYIRRYEDTFDIIYSLSSNTWAALGSGSFAFAESYLFTVEAFEDYWVALTEGGFLSMEHQVYMPRLVSAALVALARQGVARPEDHLAVYDLPQMRRNLMLLSKRPLTGEVRRLAYGELSDERFDQIHLLYPAAEGVEDNLISRIVTEGWRAVSPGAAVDVSPPTDDRPFAAQMGRWSNFTWQGLEEISQWADFRGFPLSKSIIVAILAVIVVLVLPLNLAPYLVGRSELAGRAWWYFCVIGVAFMAVEVVLIQKYALLIGASAYSIATVLLTLLLASGIGSRFAARVSDELAMVGVVVLLLLHATVFGHLVVPLSGLSMTARVLATTVLIAPLGFFMGMPFPKGALRVGDLVDWGFAVNGASSVLGATAVMLVSFTWGFTLALLAGAVMYAIAAALLMSRDWRAA